MSNLSLFLKKVLYIATFFLLLVSAGVTSYVYADNYNWTAQTGSTQATWRAVASSEDGTKLVAVVYGGQIYTSINSGAEWQPTFAPVDNWISITSSSDGTKLAAAPSSGWIYTSADSGFTWEARPTAGSRSWYSITSSSNGTKLAAVVSGGYIYTSTDSGATWTEQTSSGIRPWRSITSSSDGAKLAAVTYNGYIYTSTDSGATWTEQTGSIQSSWYSITSSSNGTKLAALVSGGYVYTSTDSGVTWTGQTGSGVRNWTAITSSADGNTLVALGEIGTPIVVSRDGGITWYEETDAGNASRYGVAISSDGSKILAATSDGYLYTGVLDITAPTITSISSTPGSGTFLKGETIIIGLNFSERVTSTGNITITLETGDIDRTCTTTITNESSTGCSYTVQDGDVSSDLDVSSISGVIKQASAAALPVTDFTPGVSLAQGTDLNIRGDIMNVYANPKNWRSITSSSDGTKLAAVAYGSYIYTSTDSGVTWTEQTGSGSRTWSSITSSSDGTKLAAGSSSYLYTSTDSGVTWTARTGPGSRSWISITSSSDGTKLAATAYNGYIYTSTDSGVTWTEQTGSGSRAWYSIASSADGTKLAAGTYNGYIYTSTDSGVTWTARTGPGSRSWYSIASSADGIKLAAVAYLGYIYTSTDSGATWTGQTGSGVRDWLSITSSSDGTKLAAVKSTGYFYTSTDSGVTWTERTDLAYKSWYDITSSADGAKLAAVTFSNGYIYTHPKVSSSASSLSDGRGILNDDSKAVEEINNSFWKSYVARSGIKGSSTDAEIDGRTSSSTGTSIDPTTGKNNTEDYSTSIRDLRHGDIGEDVRALQIFLNSQKFYVSRTGPGSPGKETTRFADATKAALKRFQATHGIPATGIVGPLTRASIIKHIQEEEKARLTR